jgi:hypothetical protein
MSTEGFLLLQNLIMGKDVYSPDETSKQGLQRRLQKFAKSRLTILYQGRSSAQLHPTLNGN